MLAAIPLAVMLVVATPCSAYFNESGIVAGDLYIAGMHSMYNQGTGPLDCAGIRATGGFQYFDATLFAMNYINANKGKGDLKDLRVNLGGISMIDCTSNERGKTLASDLQSGKLKLTAGGKAIDPATVIGYVGSANSHKTVGLAEVLTPLEITQVSYAATSVALNDVTKYPFFLRSLPDDDKTNDAMVAFIMRMGWTAIQIGHENTLFGSTSTEAFKKAAARYNIQVAQVINIQEPGKTYSDAIDQLLNQKSASVVVLLSRSTGVKKMMEARAEKNANTLIFFAGEAIGQYKSDIVFQYGKGSFTTQAVYDTVKPYITHLASRKGLGSYPENPFFDDYYMKMFGCDKTTCGKDSVTSLAAFYQDNYLLHNINAHYAIAIGTMNTLKAICGESYTTVCPEFLQTSNLRQKIFDNTMSAEFTDIVGKRFKFTDRQRISGFTIYQVGDNKYHKVGEYNSDKKFIFDDSFEASYDFSTKSYHCPPVSSTGRVSPLVSMGILTILLSHFV